MVGSTLTEKIRTLIRELLQDNQRQLEVVVDCAAEKKI